MLGGSPPDVGVVGGDFFGHRDVSHRDRDHQIVKIERPWEGAVEWGSSDTEATRSEK